MKSLTLLFTFLIFLLLCFVFSDTLILDEPQCMATMNGKCMGEIKDTKGFIPAKYVPFYKPSSSLEDLYKKSIYLK